MEQCDIYIADLDPVKGSEQSGTRPVVIISGGTMNNNFPIRIVCPITTNNQYSSISVPIKKTVKNGLAKDSVVLPFHVRTVAPKRLQKKLGVITKQELQSIIELLIYNCTY